MLAPAIPLNEAQRLAALREYAILDTPAEPGFDALTTLAAHVMNVPMALITLVDADRQWFKSRYGIDGTQTSREVSFCGHVVAAEAPLFVADALEDVRFHDNPHVTGEPRVRFYGGMPLRTPEGFVIGTVCAIDTKPRELTDQEREMLANLARLAGDQLELRRRNRLLAESEARLHATVETANDAIVTFDQDGVILQANPGVEQTFGRSPASLIGAHRSMLLAAPHRAEQEAILATYLQTGVERRIGVRGEVMAMRTGDVPFPADLCVSELGLPDRKVFTATFRDLSDRKRVERLQSEFVSTVSHELRTPLTSIRGALGLVAGGVLGELPESAREYVQIALSNSERLVRLINDFLDMEKIQSGRMEFRLRMLDLATVMRHAVVANEAYAGSHGVTLRLSPLLPGGEVVADEDRLIQVLTNLISNAAKFSPKGGEVELSVVRKDRWVRINVRDHGPGIPEAFRSRIFQRFAQADTSDTRQRGGTGLGLSISLAIVERMRGSIGFEPAEGGGTTFFVDLPLFPALSEYAARPAGGGRLLLCEDDPDARAALELALAPLGLELHVAPTLERARQLILTYQYEAVTLDLVLSDGDGMALIQDLRTNPATRNTPVIVISGMSGEEVRTHLGMAQLSVADILVKPLATSRLLDSVRSAIATGGAAEPRVLHVDPDTALRQSVRAMLPDSWDVHGVSSLAAGREALQQRLFDLILLDPALPDGPGEQLIDAVGATPVILYSVSSATPQLAQRVSAALLKTRLSEGELRRRILGALERGKARA